jgi:hypothetical protein
MDGPWIPLLALVALVPWRLFPTLFGVALWGQLGGGEEMLRELWPWLGTEGALFALGLAALCEVVLTHSVTLRPLWVEFEAEVKAVGSFVVLFLALRGSEDLEGVQRVGDVLGFVIPSTTTFPIWMIGRLRAALWIQLVEADEEDDLGLQRVIIWMEEIGVQLGALLVILFPIIVLLLVAITGGVLALIRETSKRAEEKRRHPCRACGASVYSCALFCPACGEEQPAPHEIGFLGISRSVPVTNLDRHSYALLRARRCGRCASRLPRRDIKQSCSECGFSPAEVPGFLPAYITEVDRSRPRVLLWCAVLGIVPLLGTVAGYVIYRHTLVSPFRCYVPRLRGAAIRFLLRIAHIVMILIQAAPPAGMIMLPLMALLDHAIWRRVFTSVHGIPTDSLASSNSAAGDQRFDALASLRASPFSHGGGAQRSEHSGER